MKPISERLIQSAAFSRGFLEGTSRRKVTDFILSRQNPDGGFRGRGNDSDLYYTMFAVASLKALGQPIPALNVWKYSRSFGRGDGLDLVHLVCLIRLKTAFPILPRARRALFRTLATCSADSAYGLFIKLLAEDDLGGADFPDAKLEVSLRDPTPNLAASILVNRRADAATTAALMNRAAPTGGFQPTDQIATPDLLSTATALFALVSVEAALDEIQVPAFEFIESLWRDGGGFAGHEADAFEDVEYTFYALLSAGSLIQSMAKDYGN